MDRFDKVFPLRRLLGGAAIAAAVLLGFSPGSAQIPPGEAWRTLETDHFRITYPQELLPLAQRAGERAEVAWSRLSEVFVDPPEGKVDLLLTDHTDVSNGYSTVFPSNRIVIFAPPPLDGFGLPHMDEWLELVITHELVHVFHQDLSGSLGGLLRTVFGRVPLEWPFFPGSAIPTWAVEGIAVYYESELTHAGRVRGSFHEMVVRTAVLEDRFEGIDQSSGDSPVWPGGQRYYVYGSLFLKHLLDLHGEEAMVDFVEAVAGQWIPYRLNAAAEAAFGISFSDAWEEWHRGLRTRYSALRDSLERLAPLTEGEPMSAGGYYAWSPEPAPDGEGFAFARLDGRSDPQIRFKNPATGEDRKLARTNNLSHFSWTPAGDILLSQLNHTDSYRTRGDLFLLDLEGKVARLTAGGRLDHPDVSPAGHGAVAVQEGGGSNRLVMVDLETGDLEPLTEFQEHRLWAYPRWSPDGRWIAASRWRAGAYYDVVLLSPEGELLWEVTEDRSIDNSPAWSPDGRWLLWASDRSGIPNLYGVPIDPDSGEPGAPRQITNLLGGGAYPSVDREGRWIYFSSYHADGWRIERIPFQPASWFQPFPLHPRFHGDVDPLRYRERVRVSGRPYDPLPTLRPTYWAPSYREGDQSGAVEVLGPGYGLFTSGNDLVGRHSYSFSGTLSRGPGRFNGRGSYVYRGLENPLLTLSAAQSHDAGSQPWSGITEGGDTVPIFLVERERALGFGASFVRRRSRHETVLSLSASHVWENRFFLEEDLERSDRFRLQRPEVRLAEARAALTFGNARLYPFSVSPEDGIGAFVVARARLDLTVADSLTDVAGFDRSFRDVVGQVSAYKGIRGPGFGNHVVGFRASGGLADGSGADAFHFEVGGASGSGLPVNFLDVGEGLRFPVRGYTTASRWGRYAWSATLEYRVPLLMVNWGPGLFPLHLDWISGTIFLDAGNAWGPELGIRGFQNPRRDALASAGGEILVRTLPLWFQPVNLRFGIAFPQVEGDGPQGYLRLGLSF